MTTGSGSKREAMPLCIGIGMIWLITLPRPMAPRTIMRPGAEAPNCSCVPERLEERLMEVWMTRWAFLENQSVRTITKPERSRKAVGAVEGFKRPPIMKALSAAPEACHSFQLSQAASGTPTKFTRSLPAKANARENDAGKDDDLEDVDAEDRDEHLEEHRQAVKSEKRMTAVWALIHWIHSGRMKLAPLAPSSRGSR